MKFPKIILWIIWMALLFALFMYRAFLRQESPDKRDIDIFLIVMLLGPLIPSIVIRWFYLPGITDSQKVLTFFIIGLALAESLSFYGFFVFSYYQDVFWAISLLAVLQYVPLFIKATNHTGSQQLPR